MNRIILIITFFITGCSLIQGNVQLRQNETIIRDQLSLKKNELKVCSLQDNRIDQIDLKIRVGTNKQVVYFSANNGRASKALTDCLFKVLDLMYFQNIESNKVITLNYLLTLK